MAASILAGVLPEEARARSLDTFDVTLSNWGSDPKDSYPLKTLVLDTRVQGFPYTPQGVMIGPRSTVDRCWVSWNLDKPILGDPDFVTRELSVDVPLFFAMPSREGNTLNLAAASAIGDAQAKNLLFFFPETPVSATPTISTPQGIQSTLIPETYIKADGTEADFENPLQPVLQLRFLLKSGLIPPTTKRFPYQNFADGNLLLLEGEIALGRIPTYGRKNIIIQAASSTVGSIFRIGALRASNQTIVMQETTEGLKTTAVANESLRFQLCDPMADWIIIYVTQGLPNSDIRWQITAYD